MASYLKWSPLASSKFNHHNNSILKKKQNKDITSKTLMRKAGKTNKVVKSWPARPVFGLRMGGAKLGVELQVVIFPMPPKKYFQSNKLLFSLARSLFLFFSADITYSAAL